MSLKTVDGGVFKIPTGRWKHLKKSSEWENFNKNECRGMIGTFSSSGKYLKWDSLNGTATMFAEVKEIRSNGKLLYIKHRSGLEYWFERS